MDPKEILLAKKLNRAPKRTFKEIRLLMLKELAKEQKTISDLAKTAGVNWKTTQKHLVYFVGMGFAKEVFNSPYVRIFEITEKGEDHLKKNLETTEKKSNR
jgi:predicted transcriptional regulator